MESELEMLTEIPVQFLTFNSHNSSNNITGICAVGLSLLLATPLLELHVTMVHDSGSDFVAAVTFFVSEVQNGESIMCEFHVFLVVNGRHSDLALALVAVVVNIVGKMTQFF